MVNVAWFNCIIVLYIYIVSNTSLEIFAILTVILSVNDSLSSPGGRCLVPKRLSDETKVSLFYIVIWTNAHFDNVQECMALMLVNQLKTNNCPIVFGI